MDPRAPFLTLLAQYSPLDAQEIAFKRSMLEFVEGNKDCFERSLECGHITASAWLLNKEKTHVLLMHHAKLNAWFQLGGHCDGESDVLGVALREAQEESGIMGIEPLSKTIFDIDVHRIPANSKEKEHYHYDVRFLLRVTSDEEVTCSHESKELRWVGKNLSTFPTKSISVVRMFHKWAALAY
jgi:8-oxo-dGTP pyrophosphatase MutT (NUDIX family)